MTEVKRCVQCGLLKEDDEFRPYTYSKEKGTNGRYRVCKSCEAINTAYRRAVQYVAEHKSYETLKEATDSILVFQKAHYQSIIERTEELYKTLEARGLRVPAYKFTEPDEGKTDAEVAIDNLMNFYNIPVVKSTNIAAPTDIPDELKHWLTMEQSEWKTKEITPEFLQETVYESLKAKYRPQIGVDKETYLPIYDDTYKEILNQILHRFDDYEEEFSSDTES